MFRWPLIGITFVAFFFLNSPSQVEAAQASSTILYFQSDQCEPCKQLAPLVMELHNRGWDIRKIDAPARLDVAKQFQIQNLPTLILLSDGREVDRIVGVVSKEQLHERLGRLAARTGPSSDKFISSPSPSPQPTPVVRGQSPVASGGFPMLQANTTLGMSVAPSPSQNPSRPMMSDFAKSAQASPGEHQIDPGSNQAADRAAKATVRIRVEEANTTAFGTGTIVATHGSEALILTCGHMFRDMMPGSQLKVDLFAGTPRETTVLGQVIDFKAEKVDIGLVSIQLPEPIDPVAVLPRDASIRVGQSVFTFGCDHGQAPTKFDTRIVHVNRYLGPGNVEIEGAPAVGRSGGGMFDAQGRLIGVCNAASNEDNEGIYASTDVIYEQLARVDHAHLFTSASTGGQQQPADQRGLAEQPSPDQPIQLASATLPQATLASNSDSRSSQSDVELICVLRNRDGSDRVVTIPRPSTAMLEEIRQHGK